MRCHLFILLLLSPLAAPVSAQDLAAQQAALYEAYASSLATLTESGGKGGQIAEAWLPARKQDRDYYYVLPPRQAVGMLQVAQAGSAGELAKLRRQQAEKLFQLAKRAAEAGQTSRAVALLVETLREDPDHAQARTILGYEKVSGRWCTPFDKKMLSVGQVWHSEFGWIPGDQVDSYEAGKRKLAGRWVSQEEELRRRRDQNKPWEIKTEHYRVLTTHSLEEGVRLASRLEAFYQVWRQAFAGYWLAPEELQRAIAQTSPLPQPTRQHLVICYADRHEYQRELLPQEPRIEGTLGIYFDKKRRAYFFAGPEQDSGTLYHEAAHQLFQELLRAGREAGRKNNFWVVEGIACYCESLAEEGEFCTLGGRDRGRVPAACVNLASGIYVSFRELASLGRVAMQEYPNLPKLYSQSAGAAMFLMHAQGGKYREPFLRYLSQVYRGQADPETLAKLCGTRFEDLDRAYRRYFTAAGP